MNFTKEELEEIPEELQELMLDKIGELTFQRTIDRCAELLPPNKQKILLEMLETDSIGFHTVIEFLEESIPNFTQIAQEEGSIVAKQMRE